MPKKKDWFCWLSIVMAGTKSNNPTIIMLKAINADIITLPIISIDCRKWADRCETSY